MRATLPAPEAFGLPFLSWRSAQARAILTAFDSRRRIVGLQLPTGVGKSAVAIALAQLLDVPTVILTATKALQDQYADTVGDLATDIRGMGNYACPEAGESFNHLFLGRQHVGCDEGPCRVGKTCPLKVRGCPFFDAVRAAAASPIVVTSYANWIATLRHRRGVLGPRLLVILDEAHDAPTQLADHLHVKLANWDLPLPAQSEVRSHDEWREWAAGQATALEQEIKRVRVHKKKLQLKHLKDSLDTIALMSDDWVVWRQRSKVEFAPTVVRPFSRRYLWPDAKTVVLLSAIVTPRTARMLGVKRRASSWYRAPSPFPVSRRPIYCFKDTPGIRIDHRVTDEMIDWWVHRMDEWIEARLDRKGIIHTVSYARQKLILERSQFRRYMLAPMRANQVASAVQEFKHAPVPRILVSPSVMTGFDFPYQTCEYQIVGKVPFPDTRSEITKARVANDRLYGPYTTMQLLVQAVGRGMRAEDDACETLILDDHIHWFLGKHGRLAPSWFTAAVQRVSRMPDPPAPLALASGA